MDNVDMKSLRSWLEYVAEDYQKSRNVSIDAGSLYKEIVEKEIQ